MPEVRPIVIAGGGPVGFIAAFALGRQGFPVELYEAEARINDSPRAATTHAATLEMLEELGLVDEVKQRGLIEPRFRIWDRAGREIIAEFDFGLLKGDTPYPYVVQCEQHKLANMTLDRLAKMPNVTVVFSSKVVSFEDKGGRVSVTVETPAGAKQVEASYVIGCDGGRSTVRKLCDIEFEGYTHPERFLVLSTPYAFESEYGACSRNYFSDPEEWSALFKVSGDDGRGLTRIVFPARAGESEEAAFAEDAVQARLQKFFPKDGAYPSVHRNMYNVHQRVAASFRKGRVFLAGDAAHINNPLGGLGLNFGIHDALELADLLGQTIRGEAPAAALDLYDTHRRPLNVEYVQAQTIANKKRLEEKDPAARAKSNAALRETTADPVKHRAYLLRASLLEAVQRRKAAAA